MDWLPTAAVAVVLVLAGCSQAGLWEPSASPSTEVTPIPVPNATGSLVDVDGEVDAYAVTRAHADALAVTNYTMRVNQRVVGPDGDQLRTLQEYREVSRGAGAYSGYVQYNVSVEALREFGTTHYWTNGTHIATRFDSPLRQARTKLWETESNGPVSTPSNSRQLLAFLQATEPPATDSLENGTVRLTGAARYPSGQFAMPPALSNPRNVSSRLHVRGDGVVVRWRFAYDATFSGETIRVVQTGEITAIGETAVDRPRWIDNATSFEDVR
jgi:hypothetical protein